MERVQNVDSGLQQVLRASLACAGPKTLCNACGVRYNRAQQRLSKRGSTGTGRSASPVGRGAGARAAKCGKTCEPVQQAPPCRPMRQAAVLAANRTAEFARTGTWATDDDEAPGCSVAAKAVGSKRSIADREELKSAGKQQAAATGLSRDSSSHDSTGFAERLCEEESEGQCGSAAAMAAEGGMQDVSQLPSLDLRQLAQRASSFVSGMSEYAPVLAQWEQLKEQLPKDALASLVQVGQDLERAANEAAAADAALAAVHAVLIARQEAADKARDGAMAAANRMASFMTQLSSQFPLLDVPSCASLQPDLDMPGMGMEDDPLDAQDALNSLILNPCQDTGMCGDEDLLTLEHLGPELMSA